MAEIEQYQKVIDGCNLLIDNYKPVFEVKEEWERVKLGEVCKIQSGGTPSRETAEYWNNGDIPWIKTGQIDFKPITEAEEFITEEGLKNSSTRMIEKGTILMAMYGQGITRGRVAMLEIDATINQAVAAISLKSDEVLNEFLYLTLQSKYEEIRNLSENRGGNQSNLNAQMIKDLEIPLPSLEEQAQIVAELEADMAVVNGAKRLREKMQAKINGVIAKVWG